jgi:hypothetical protein
MVLMLIHTNCSLTFLVHHFSLSEEVATRREELALTVDGALLDETAGHVTIGFKVCDKDSICPIMKLLIFNEDKERSNLQLGKFCFPDEMLLTKDNKETYNKYLHDIFNDVELLSDEGMPELSWLPFDIPEPQDMKSFQLCLGRGGACKVNTYPCHLCQLYIDNVQLPNQIACQKCASASPVAPPTSQSHIPISYLQPPPPPPPTPPPPPPLPTVPPLHSVPSIPATIIHFPPVPPIPTISPITVTPPFLPKKL